MSADNYYLIRKVGDLFAVSTGFMSDECDPVIEDHHPRFGSLEAAVDYADSEYSEYGYYIENGPHSESGGGK